MSASPEIPLPHAELRIEPTGWVCEVAGHWQVGGQMPPDLGLSPLKQLAGQHHALTFISKGLQAWDSSLVVYLLKLVDQAKALDMQLDFSGLPEGLTRLLSLARAVPAVQRQSTVPTWSLPAQVGHWVLDWWHRWPANLAFVGELTVSIGRFCVGKARFRPAEFFALIEACGPRALPIVTLISFLVGTILAYMGAAQLGMFGAQVYIADLVGIGMVREIGALMTGILLAGRTGAAFAAQLGTMQVNEEIDAFQTLGIRVMDFLVLPRFISLLAMAPLLTLYAGIVGVIAGGLIAVTVYDVGLLAYYFRTLQALKFNHFMVGMLKGTVYGGLVAFAGCLCGMRCGRSAQAVGEATTAAVVLGILLMTIAAALLTMLFKQLGI